MFKKYVKNTFFEKNIIKYSSLVMFLHVIINQNRISTSGDFKIELTLILSLFVILNAINFCGKLTLFDEKCRIWKRFLLCLINHIAGNCNNSWLDGLLKLILRDCWFERPHPGFKNLFSQSIPLEKCTYSHWIAKY